MLSKDHGFLLLAYSGRTPIAGAVFLRAKATLTFKYSASLKPFWPLRPNALLLWTAIQHACQSGMRVFDFGRTELNDHGLRDFKLNWGAREEELSYTVLGRSSASHFPAVAQATAGVVIRHSPAIVCRALGTSLYKYA
jgi:CelD/BcsL family acetyltransferase involved in cellulose biosynthesis